MKSALRHFSSLRLTVVTLLAAIVLVFFGTIAQAHLGLWETQKQFFQSFLVWWPVPGTDLRLPVWPGGYLLGWILVINLVYAHGRRFRFTLRNSGLFLTHLGVLLLLLGQFVTEQLQVESSMRLETGETKTYSESPSRTELAISEIQGNEENVIVISDKALRSRRMIKDPRIPFVVELQEWQANSEPRLDHSSLKFAEIPITRRMDEMNLPSARILTKDSHGQEQTCLVSIYLSNPLARRSLANWARAQGQPDALEIAMVRCDGREFNISLRAARYYKFFGGRQPSKITLLDFRNERYAGTAIARNYSSRILLTNPNTGEQREALIYMNTPFRYGGETFYQGGFDPRQENVSVLQVVRNPVWLSPYISCLLVAVGLLVHFVLKFSVSRPKARSSAPAAHQPVWIPVTIAVIIVGWIISQMLSARSTIGFAINEFGKLPVHANGRIQPFDSLARNSLLAISGKSIVRLSEGKLKAMEWLLNVMIRPDIADSFKTFRLENLELRARLSAREGRLGFVSFSQLSPILFQLQQEAIIIQDKTEPSARTGYQRDLLHLCESVLIYQRLKNTLQPDDTVNFASEIATYREKLPGLVEALKTMREDDPRLATTASYLRRFQWMARMGYAQAIPGQTWLNVGEALLTSLRTGTLPESLTRITQLTAAYANGDCGEFNQSVAAMANWTAAEKLTTAREAFYNRAEFFYKATLLYAAGTLAGFIFWFRKSEVLRRSALAIMLVALALHSSGLIFRIVLYGRPPVTNLYSSAVFIGWGAVILGLFIERRQRTALGLVVSGLIGFVTQIIAHHLAASGDTMPVLEAVLDTNVWLATHVLVITTGYAAMFLAGGIAFCAILRRALDRSLAMIELENAAKIIFGVICFATLFSFGGTVLGGIWADQSWGRFWGWDPKENGAMLIVLWCAVVLHARLAGWIRARGLIICALIGNIVTAFSWFGVNLLGIGLHSYGFMEGAFRWLIVFICTQLAFIIWALAMFAPADKPEAKAVLTSEGAVA